MTWFAENIVELMNWPARSQDLNPIEHIWSIIDQRITGIKFESLAKFEEELVKQWNAESRVKCINLIESMPKRVRLCLKAECGYFNY